jgi:hypothetical protein
MAITIDKDKVVRQIKDSNNEIYTIDAPLWEGHRFSEVQSMVHGVVDTYVIPAQSDAADGSDYKKVVETSAAQVSIAKSNLNTLTSTTNTYKVGDIILMGATSDGKINFDRWVSKITGTGASAIVYLDVLETQVATHHHTITTTSAKALTSITPSATNTIMATTGANTTVVTGKDSSDVTSGWDFLTSVAYGNDDEIDFTTSSTSTSTNVGHSHTISSHNHSVTIGHSNLVSSRVSAYTSLTSVNRTLHDHNSDVAVAGSTTNDSSATTIVTGGGKNTVITSLKDSEQNTGKNTAGLATGSNSSGLSTSAQTSSDSIGDIVKTKSDGSHSHTLSSAETANVITSATVAAKVITNVTAANNTSVASNVVTGVTYVSTKVATGAAVGNTTSASFVNKVSVDASGILSFGSASALTGVTVTYTSTYIGSVTSHSTATQSAKAPTLTLSSTTQSVSYGKVAVSGTISANGSHTHGFSHTHSIPAHTHSIASHTHTYNKSIKDGTVDAYTSLSSTSRTLHSHATDATVAGSIKNDASPTKIITGGSRTSVVESLVANKAFSTTSSNPTTDTQYYDIDIKYPGLTLKGRKFATKNITEASATTVKPIVSVGSSSDDFIKTVSRKTSKNIGGE